MEADVTYKARVIDEVGYRDGTVETIRDEVWEFDNPRIISQSDGVALVEDTRNDPVTAEGMTVDVSRYFDDDIVSRIYKHAFEEMEREAVANDVV